ncbi:hypothetical protein [Marinobacter sp. CHS3-4]|uniref:hypothetical protein n=1 Tax=Marinobacter sp. CHS3-4 TaxID=3045174 RepID=UPI0024B5E766|nr:hypothetical protein [Marinobacter sp. CHS3-4]MDI9245070.1 hypothetical protein [Marinobacter sp. CHS3-4]
MLKELWKKLGSEFSSTDESGPGDTRLLPHMTHTGEFHLERLTSLVESRYNRSFKGQGDESVRELIHFASRIQDQDIQRELLLFYLNCSPFIQEYLRSEEVLDGNHFLSQNSSR